MKTTGLCRPIGAGVRRLSLLVCLSVALTACHNDKSMLPQDRSDSAAQEVYNAQVRRSEHGKLQLEMDAPIIKKFDRPKPRTLYHSAQGRRVQLRLYDEEHKVKTIIEAGNAVSFDDRDIMEAHDSVVVIDFSNNDTIYLKDLIWNSAEDRIYSDNPVRAKNGSRITEGDGFTSDQRMENMQILHQRGVIEFKD